VRIDPVASPGVERREARASCSSPSATRDGLGCVDLLADGLWECDFSTRELNFSPRWLASLGYRSEDLPRDLRVLRDLFHPDDYTRLIAPMAAHLRGETPVYQVECRIRAKSGEWRWFASRGRVVERDEAGRAVRIFGINHDISDRAAAEDALRKSEEKYAKGFHANPDSVMLSRLSDGLILECNRSGLRLGRYTRDEMIGKSVAEIGLWADPAEREKGIRALQSTGEYLDQEIKIRARDGSMRVAIVSARTIEVDGETCILSVARDMTEQRELEDRLRQAQKMEAVGQLAEGIAHDFNNLLLVISGHGEALFEQLEPGSQLSQSAEEIVHASSRAASLTQQLLGLGRRETLQLQVLDPNEIVREMDRLLQRLIGEEIELSTNLDPQLGRVKVDPSQIQQLLMNLTVNARDAMPDGGPLLVQTRNVSPRQARDIAGVELAEIPYVCLSVTDAGVGIPEEVRNQIFEPFFTTKEPGRGTGLGLATVYGIAKQSGGDVRVESRSGHGSTFEIFLPAVPDQIAASRPGPAMAPGGEFEGRTILVVEDEPSVRRVLRVVLERSGLQVLEAPNGQEALVLAAAGLADRIDLVLTDVRMPQMGGLEMSRRLRTTHPETRVVLMTGYADPTAREQAELHEAGELLLKPFSPTELLAKLREALASGDILEPPASGESPRS
jgi:PAS domain S-box-containing protein